MTEDQTRVLEALEIAADVGAYFELKRDIVTVHIPFTAGDTAEYIGAEDAANRILSRFRMVAPGTVWGTDSASVGGFAGLANGHMRLSKSGVSKRQVTFAAKQLA